MAEILLVNPRRRRHRHHKRRHMTALQRSYFGNPRRRRHHHRHVARNPHRRRHHYRRNPSFRADLMPVITGGAIGAVGGLLTDVVAGFANPQIASLTGLSLTSNPALLALSKILYAVGVGWLGGKAWSGKGHALAVGGATIAIHDFAKPQLAAAVPSIPLGYVSYGPVVSGVPASLQATRASTYRPVGKYLRAVPQRGMGKYLSGVTQYAEGIPCS